MSEVYIIEHELGPLKIGVAKRPSSRLRDLQTSCPYELSLKRSKQCDDAQAVENYLHTRFSHYRMRGEWFDIPPRERKFEIPRTIKDDGSPEPPVPEVSGRDVFDEWADTFNRLVDSYQATRYSDPRFHQLRGEVKRLKEEDPYE